MSMPNTAAATLGIKYSLHGSNITVCNACAAGTTAIGRAYLAIRGGEADAALAGGVEYLRDDYGGIFRAFDAAKTLVDAGEDPSKANRPFDKARTGFLFAEGGAAILMMESLDHALARGARPLAEICSFAETFDAYSMMSPDPSGKHIELMLRAALTQAGITALDIDYINAHGTGTVVNDDIEARTIERIFGDKPLVNSTKSLIGHSVGASGAIEVAVTALSIQSQTTHICKNLENPILPLRFVREAKAYPIQKALTQSFAFGGHNAAVVLSRL
jgi:3-oxoacyl-[acyl-carrier-protein] synthase II